MTTYLKASTVEDYYSSFLVRPTKIEGQPSYDDIRCIREVIYLNAAAVPSTRGGARHGHLGMIIEPELYETIAPGRPWADPGIPAPPDFTDLTGPQILELNRRYAEAQKEQKEFDNLQKAQVNQISTALEELYIDPFREPYLGLSGLTARTVIAWLMANYGAIIPQAPGTHRQSPQVG
jgi:hypothetical protein